MELISWFKAVKQNNQDDAIYQMLIRCTSYNTFALFRRLIVFFLPILSVSQRYLMGKKKLVASSERVVLGLEFRPSDISSDLLISCTSRVPT